MDIILNDIAFARICLEYDVFTNATGKGHCIWFSQFLLLDSIDPPSQKLKCLIADGSVRIYEFDSNDVSEIYKILKQDIALTLSQASCIYMSRLLKSSAFYCDKNDIKLKQLCVKNKINIYDYEWFFENIIGERVFEKKTRLQKQSGL